MNFSDFKKNLNKNNIYLFDSEYRISYYNLMNCSNQYGGGKQKELTIFKNKSSSEIKDIVDISLSSNILFLNLLKTL